MLTHHIFDKLTSHTKNCLHEAEKIASASGAASIKPYHLFRAIFETKGCAGHVVLKNIGVTDSYFEKTEKDTQKNTVTEKITLSDETKKIIIKGFTLAHELNYPYVGTEHLVYALMESQNPEIKKILQKVEKKMIEKKQAEKSTTLLSDGGKKLTLLKNTSDPLSHISKMFNIPTISLTEKNSLEDGTPSIDQFCKDMVQDSDTVSVIGRDTEIERLFTILSRKKKNNPLLVGEPGVGKSTLIQYLAQQIKDGRCPKILENKRILNFDIALTVAGTNFRGEFEARLKEILYEAETDRNVILFIDEIHNIVGAGNSHGSLDAANILKPALADGRLQCIGATTYEEYKKHIEKDPALERRFQTIHLTENTKDETISILLGLKKEYELFHGVTITPDAIYACVELSDRFINDRFFPDKALDVLDEASATVHQKDYHHKDRVKIAQLKKQLNGIIALKNSYVEAEQFDKASALRKKEEKISSLLQTLQKNSIVLDVPKNRELTRADIEKTIATMCNIPENKIQNSGTKEIQNLKENLCKKITGQEEAIQKITETMHRSYSGVASPHRPLGSFLFLGPTGVGKTLTAQSLAGAIFHKNAFLRIDMSEFMERHGLAQLLGAPAGYIGYGSGGRLTEFVRKNPHSVILFDEIEKAHPDVSNILLQILEDGTLTDAEGRSVNFKNTLIILTSNLGTESFVHTASKIGFGDTHKEKTQEKKFEAIKDTVLEELKENIAPELLSRLDHVIVFKPLLQKDYMAIARHEMEFLKDRLIKRNITLLYPQKIFPFITGFITSDDHGARGIRKIIQEKIENPIAQKIVTSSVKNNTLTLTLKKNKLHVN